MDAQTKREILILAIGTALLEVPAVVIVFAILAHREVGSNFYFGRRLRVISVPALFLARNLVCSQSPLIGARGSRIFRDESGVFAGI
jgi:hypothetical protein